MKLALALVALACVACVASAYTFESDAHFVKFFDYTRTFNKQYASTEEFLIRFNNFKASLARMEKAQSANPLAKFAINQFSDMSVEEFKAKMLGFQPHKQADTRVSKLSFDEDALPSSFDWRSKGAVSPVKDQQQCGSCWAFSATEEIESMWWLAQNKSGPVLTLSPQQIVSCDTVDGGCGGGDTPTAYAYVQSAGGLESDSDYPYTSGGGDTGTCQFDASKIVAHISKNTPPFHWATPNCNDSCTNQDENKLATSLVNEGPVSICVYAESWMDYAGGVYTDTAGCPSDYSSLDHCVQLVGYDKTGSVPYWIVRNSWNTGWGDQGYIYLEMGKNICGVADEATIVDIN